MGYLTVTIHFLQKMSEEKTTHETSVKANKSRKNWIHSAAHHGMLLSGIMLTLLSTLWIKSHADTLTKNKYETIAVKTVELISSRFKEISLDLKLLSKNYDAAQKLGTTNFQVPFNEKSLIEIFMAQKDSRGNYFFTPLQSNRKKQNPTPEISMNKTIVEQISKNGFAVSTEKKQETINNSNAILFMARMNQEANNGTLLVGVFDTRLLLNNILNPNINYISEISLNDPASNLTLAKMDLDKNENSTFQNSYEFEIEKQKIEASLSLTYDEETKQFIILPYYFAFLGLLLTFLSSYYSRSIQKKLAQTLRAQHALQKKNASLTKEIEEKKHLHQDLEKAKKDSKTIIDSVNDIIFETDVLGKMIFLNSAWKKISGFDVDQSLGQNIFSVLHPQDQEKQRKDFHSFLSGQKSAYRSFARLRTSEGSFRAVELSLSMTRQDAENNVRVVGTMTDVEERRRTERALSEAEKKYRTIVDNAAGGIFQITPEGIYLSANPALARILGYTDSHELLRSIKNANDDVYFNSKERQFFLKELENTGSIHNYETQIIKKNGERIWVNENIRVVKDETGHTLYYEGSLEDITQRKQAEIALRQEKIHSDLANRSKSEFLSNMSHELRTPLNSIIGFSEIIRSETFGPVGQNVYKEYANDIFQSGKKLLGILSEILEIAKIEAGERYLNEQILDIKNIVKNCLGILDSKAKAGDITINNFLKDPPQLVAEELAIKQIFLSLLSNAIKFTPPGGCVTITNESDSDGSLRISISDTGVGLDAAEMEKALSPFGQTNSTLSRPKGGTGLGLTLAQALIKMHDGKLEFVSQKGIGTTATIILPADRTSPGSTNKTEQNTQNTSKQVS